MYPATYYLTYALTVPVQSPSGVYCTTRSTGSRSRGVSSIAPDQLYSTQVRGRFPTFMQNQAPAYTVYTVRGVGILFIVDLVTNKLVSTVLYRYAVVRSHGSSSLLPVSTVPQWLR